MVACGCLMNSNKEKEFLNFYIRKRLLKLKKHGRLFLSKNIIEKRIYPICIGYFFQNNFMKNIFLL